MYQSQTSWYIFRKKLHYCTITRFKDNFIMPWSLRQQPVWMFLVDNTCKRLPEPKDEVKNRLINFYYIGADKNWKNWKALQTLFTKTSIKIAFSSQGYFYNGRGCSEELFVGSLLKSCSWGDWVPLTWKFYYYLFKTRQGYFEALKCIFSTHSS